MSGLHGAVLGLLWDDVAAANGQRGCGGVRCRTHVGAWFSTTPLQRAKAAGMLCSPIKGLPLGVVSVGGRCVVAEQHGLPSPPLKRH